LLGNPLPERVAGSDLVPLLIDLAAERNYRLFFLGASEESSRQAVANLRKSHPGLALAGFYSPPFNPLLEMDHDEIRRRILQAKPDLLFVSFGCPKQEKWIAMHYRHLGVPVAVGVGGTIDLLTGQLKRAPRWMRRTGSEWIFRLVQEPQRLFRRYLKDLWVFGWAILSQWWRLQAGQSRSWSRLVSAKHTQAGTSWQCVKAPGRLDLLAVESDALKVEGILEDGRDCFLEMSEVGFIDSTGVGLLIRLQKQLRALGRQLVLQEPSATVRGALGVMHLQEVFACVQDYEAALELLEARCHETQVNVSLRADGTLAVFTWQGEVTAANAEEVWRQTRAQLLSVASSGFIVDISRVRFIDSSGLSVMVRTRKLARQRGIDLVFKDLQPAVRNVLRLARLEGILAEEASNSNARMPVGAR
jgi:N-acetylglucosaminyldiphosphoundecaprenol N-acetyl-beta-D-mannosaminyltransferase